MRRVTESYARVGRHKLKIKEEERNQEIMEEIEVDHLLGNQWRTLFSSIFLPQGYPHSVTGDYIEYQLWDTVQAFASSITGALATEAVLKGAGVGNEKATALAASMTWLVKDGLGMIGRILFSYAKGSQLDYDCKKWRLTADILNDFAFFIDLLCPLWPNWFLLSACLSSLFRCVVGVAGGATRTTIVQHQARRNNLADVAAKDGSQETLVNAAALIVSLFLLPSVSGKHTIIWILFGLLTVLHLFANYRAVRSLKLDVLNGKRAAIVMREYIKTGQVLSIEEANDREPLFYNTYPTRHLGCSLKKLLESRRSQNMVYVESPKYTILYDSHYGTSWIAMSEHPEANDQLNALYDLEQLITNQKVKPNYHTFTEDLRKRGWRTDVHHLNFDEWTYRDIH